MWSWRSSFAAVEARVHKAQGSLDRYLRAFEEGRLRGEICTRRIGELSVELASLEAGVRTGPRRYLSPTSCSTLVLMAIASSGLARTHSTVTADERRESLSQEVIVSAISCTKLFVASKGAAWAAPSMRCTLAAGIAEASDLVQRTMKSGLREP